MQRDQAHTQNELLRRIAVALEKGNTTKAVELSGERNTELSAKAILDVVGKITDDYASKRKAVTHADVHNAKYNNDIPGFEGTLEDLHNIKLHTDEGPQDDDNIHNDYLNDLVTDMTKEQYVKFFLDMDFGFALSDTAAFKQHCYVLDYEECLDAIKSALHITGETDIEERIENDIKYATPTSDNPDPYDYDNNLREYHCGVVNDSDFNIRKTADSYQAALDCETHFTSKKECILDYITNEFGILGARYTDIIKFAYYLGEPNAPKYDNANRGYYSCAFNTRFGGHLIQGGKDCLVKGINKEGKEKYFAFSFVEQATDYWKYTDNRSAR